MGDGRMYGQTDIQMDKHTDQWTDRSTYGISPHSTGLHPLLGPLPKKESIGGSGRETERRERECMIFTFCMI